MLSSSFFVFHAKGARHVVFLVHFLLLRFAGLHASPSRGLVVARQCTVLQEREAAKASPKSKGT